MCTWSMFRKCSVIVKGVYEKGQKTAIVVQKVNKKCDTLERKLELYTVQEDK